MGRLTSRFSSKRRSIQYSAGWAARRGRAKAWLPRSGTVPAAQGNALGNQSKLKRHRRPERAILR